MAKIRQQPEWLKRPCWEGNSSWGPAVHSVSLHDVRFAYACRRYNPRPVLKDPAVPAKAYPTMDSTTSFFDLLKSVLPALIVAGIIYLLFSQFLEKEQQRRLIEMRLETNKTMLPLRLQAYERIVLFLERISPNNILVRLSSAGSTAPEFHRLLQQEIRAEFEHNLSQQLYISADAWTLVKEAKENVLTMVNRAFHGIQNPAQARGTELAKRILEGLMMDGSEPTAQALAVVKNEAAGLF